MEQNVIDFETKLDSNSEAVKEFSEKALSATQKGDVIDNIKNLLKTFLNMIESTEDVNKYDDEKTLKMANQVLENNANNNPEESSLEQTQQESKWNNEDFAEQPEPTTAPSPSMSRS